MKLAQTNLSKLAQNRPAVAKRQDCGVFSAAFPQLLASRRAQSGDESPQSRRFAPFTVANAFVAQTNLSKLKACNHSAQGWPRQRTTLGKSSERFFNPIGVGSSRRGRLMQPFQGYCRSSLHPRVARSSQPWADLWQPFRLLQPARVARAVQIENISRTCGEILKPK